MISSIIHALFLLKFSPIRVSKKRNDKKSMIPKPSQSFFVKSIVNSYNVYVKTGFSIKSPTMVDMP